MSVQSFFQELHSFAATTRTEFQQLTGRAEELQALSREKAAEAEGSQLTYLQFGVKNLEEQVQQLHTLTTSSLSFTEIFASFSELYNLNQRCLAELGPMVQARENTPEPEAPAEDEPTGEQSENDETPVGFDQPECSFFAQAGSFDAENAHLNTPVARNAIWAKSSPTLEQEPEQRTPPPVRFLDFDLLQSQQKEKRADADRKYATATETLTRLRTPKKVEPRRVREPEGKRLVTEEDIADIRQHSSYLFLRCSLDDINAFIGLLDRYMVEHELSYLTEEDIAAATPEKNRKTLLLVLKKLERLHTCRSESSQLLYSLDMVFS